MWLRWIIAVVAMTVIGVGAWTLVDQQEQINQLEQEADALEDQVGELAAAQTDTHEVVSQLVTLYSSDPGSELERDLRSLEGEVEDLEWVLFGQFGRPAIPANDLMGDLEREVSELQTCLSRLTDTLRLGSGPLPLC